MLLEVLQCKTLSFLLECLSLGLSLPSLFSLPLAQYLLFDFGPRPAQACSWGPVGLVGPGSRRAETPCWISRARSSDGGWRQGWSPPCPGLSVRGPNLPQAHIQAPPRGRGQQQNTTRPSPPSHCHDLVLPEAEGGQIPKAGPEEAAAGDGV